MGSGKLKLFFVRHYSFAGHIKCVSLFTHVYTPVPLHIGRFTCSTCNQFWAENVAADMGKECLSFICKKYPGNGFLKIAALGIKHRGIVSSGTSSLEYQKRAAQDVLAAIEERFNGEKSIPEFPLLICDFVIRDL